MDQAKQLWEDFQATAVALYGEAQQWIGKTMKDMGVELDGQQVSLVTNAVLVVVATTLLIIITTLIRCTCCKKKKQPTKTLTESQDYSAGVTKMT